MSCFLSGLDPLIYDHVCSLQLKKVPLQLVTGLQRLRGQLKTLVVQRCHMGVGMETRLLENIEDVIVRCCGDESTSFAWNSLKELDLSSNSIRKLGDSLVSEILTYIQFHDRMLSDSYYTLIKQTVADLQYILLVY